MFQTLKNAWKTQELKSKLLFTLLIVILYRVGCCIPVPWVNSKIIADYFTQSFGAMQLMMGNAFSQANLFALSVSPYITSSIIMQLLTIAIPALERMAKDGEEGKKKIAMITRIVTMVLAVITAVGYSTTLVYGNFNGASLVNLGTTNAIFAVCVMTACFCAGAAIVMWMAERINEFGIGNGISIILFANIIARLPEVFVGFKTTLLGKDWTFFGDTVQGVIGKVMDDASQTNIINLIINIVWIFVVLALLIGIVWLVVWFNDSERRIPVQYAKRVVGRKMYGGQSSTLPLKLNMAGVMPVIFANSIVSIPSTLNMMFQNQSWAGWIATLANDYFSYTKPLYVLISIILLFAFAYFYIMISFNPVEVANNIRNNGGAVPGIRPGKPTSDYIKKILNRITFIGAIFLCVVSEVPKLIVSLFNTAVELYVATGSSNKVLEFITNFYNGGTDMTIYSASQSFMTVAFAGTSILIVVGVILETVRELEAQLTMRNYKGFLD